MEWLVFFLIFIGILIVKMMFDGSLKGIGHLFNDMQKNNVRSELKDKSKMEYYTIMCARLNEGGFRNNGKYWRLDSPDFFSSVMDNYDAVKYLKEYHLLNNGKCPICGKSFDYEEIDVEYHNTYYRQEIKGWEMTFPNGATCHVCEECATKQKIEEKSGIKNKTKKIVLESILKTDPAILNFKETRYDSSSRRNTVRRASIEINRNKLQNLVLNCTRRGFKFSEPKDCFYIFPKESNPVTIQDILPEFRNMTPAIVYEYISAELYEDLSDVERRAYQPAIVPRTNFYQTNPETGEVVRDENGRAIVESTGAAYFTDSLGDILFRTAQIRDVSALENEKRFVMKPLDQDAFDMLEDCPAAIEAINARLQVATEQETAADDISAILMSSIEKSHIANLVMLSRLEGVVYPGAEMAVEKLAKMNGVILQEVGMGWRHTICPSSDVEKQGHILGLLMVMAADGFISQNQYDFASKIANDYGYSKEAFDNEIIEYIESAESEGIHISDLREQVFLV